MIICDVCKEIAEDTITMNYISGTGTVSQFKPIDLCKECKENVSNFALIIGLKSVRKENTNARPPENKEEKK